MQERQGFTPAEKELMLLSRETREGLRITGMYICIAALLKFMHGVVYLYLLCIYYICSDVTHWHRQRATE